MVRFDSKLKDIRQKLKRRMHAPIVETKEWLSSVVRGYFPYHGLPDNQKRLREFRGAVLHMWLRQLRRRSQRSNWTWARFLERLGSALPAVAVHHPWPRARFAARHSR
jgi:RNA-directed DNA polymerase